MKYGFHIIWGEEDEGYIATCPDFPGLSAFGETLEEASEQAKVALELFIDTYEEDKKPLPTPTTKQEYSGQFRLRIPKGLHRDLVNGAQRDGVSLNAYTIYLLTQAQSQNYLIEKVKPQLQRIENNTKRAVVHFKEIVGTPFKYNPKDIEHYHLSHLGVKSETGRKTN
jgi:predicted RNase H-like HicB family nuclease